MLTIVKYPDPVLRLRADPLDDIGEDIRRLSENMIEAMYLDEGVGLAAPQIGVSKRLIVLDVGEGPFALINPEIVHKGEEQRTVEEGCLSFPGIRIDIARPSRIVVRGTDSWGELREIDAENLIARVLQHEIDHLNGVLIIDHASSLQRSLLKSKLRKLEKK